MSSDCLPSDIALKSIFLGPQSENADWFERKVEEVLSHTFKWRQSRFPQDGRAISLQDTQQAEFIALQKKMSSALQELLHSLEGETPKFTPRYIGHMVSEISLPSLLAEFALLLHNPNNASKEAAKVGLVIERQAIEDLAKMIGFNPNLARGHFTSCGTVANFEALWRCLYWFDRKLSLALCLIDKNKKPKEDFFNLCHVSREKWLELSVQFSVQEVELNRFSILLQGPWGVPIREIIGTPFRGPILLVPGNRHYSWPKAAAVFGLGNASAWTVSLDKDGRLDVNDLKQKIEQARKEQRPILSVTSVAGTTELGEVDPIGEVQAVLEQHKNGQGLHLWHHVDAAYGGFFSCLKKSETSLLSQKILSAFEAFAKVDSITIDPHKLGYVPYACGAFLVKDEIHYQTYQVRAPYLQKETAVQAGWATTLEGSRSAAGAAAVWLTAKTLPFDSAGLGRILEKTIEAKHVFASELAQVQNINLVSPSDTNVLCFSFASKSDDIKVANNKTMNLFEKIEREPNFSVSRTTLLRSSYAKMISRLCGEWQVVDDGISDLVVIRLVLMNPFIVSKEMQIDFAKSFAQELK